MLIFGISSELKVGDTSVYVRAFILHKRVLLLHHRLWYFASPSE